jgi:hypothetical protein
MTTDRQWHKLRETIRVHFAKHGRCIQVICAPESDAPSA